MGNHDSFWTKNIGAEGMEKYFESVDSYLETSDGNHGLTLCHYPMLSYGRDSKNYMIHGHIHNNVNMNFWPCLRARERVLNAGVDLNGFKPVTFDELVENNRRFKEENQNCNREV
ncbi:MAG: hypothetical protein LUD77_00110 [Clostridiales bacterium]|nr:hypothetical protein [Clostridiales bacterium]